MPDPDQPAPAPTPTPTPQKIFRVVTDSLKTRSQPSLGGATVSGATLKLGDQMTVAANAWREVDGYVWWQHNQGWSAERSLDNTTRFLEDLMPDVPRMDNGVSVPTPTPTPAPTPSFERPTAIPDFKRMHAVGLGVKVRSEPDSSAPQVGTLIQGDEFPVDTTQPGVRVENDGYIWWKHSGGWSAERSLSGAEILMLDLFELPLLGTLFQRLPVRIEDTQWVQY
ncbi:MAG: SH3 domain-containing protein, partial [Anaerolineae bacterium]|nr:SH3 domain-containing protein [Anaerolineae bacterium]